MATAGGLLKLAPTQGRHLVYFDENVADDNDDVMMTMMMMTTMMLHLRWALATTLNMLFKDQLSESLPRLFAGKKRFHL